MGEKWLTTEGLAELVGLAPTTVRDMVTKRAIPHTRLGPKTVRFTPEDVAAIKQKFAAPAITDTPSRAKARTRIPRQRRTAAAA